MVESTQSRELRTSAILVGELVPGNGSSVIYQENRSITSRAECLADWRRGIEKHFGLRSVPFSTRSLVQRPRPESIANFKGTLWLHLTSAPSLIHTYKDVYLSRSRRRCTDVVTVISTNSTYLWVKHRISTKIWICYPTIGRCPLETSQAGHPRSDKQRPTRATRFASSCELHGRKHLILQSVEGVPERKFISCLPYYGAHIYRLCLLRITK